MLNAVTDVPMPLILAAPELERLKMHISILLLANPPISARYAVFSAPNGVGRNIELTYDSCCTPTW